MGRRTSPPPELRCDLLRRGQSKGGRYGCGLGLKSRVPVVVTNVSKDGEACRIFIQRTGPADACFACYRPDALRPAAGTSEPCAPVPAIADILHVAVGV